MKRSLKVNPELKPCTWNEIKAWRNTHESSPVTTSFGSFDADDLSVTRIQEAIEQFDDLPTLAAGKLVWKLADNSFLPLTKTELQQVLTELKQARSIRGALLHVKAEQFNLLEVKPNNKNLSNLSFWGIS